MTWSIVIPAIVTLILCATGLILHKLWGRGLTLLARKTRMGLAVSDDILARSRREILNLPVSSCIISLLTWGLAAIIMSGIRYWIYSDENAMQAAWHQAFRVWFGITVSGLVTSAIVLFAMEFQCRKIRPLFFPHGGLRDTPGVVFLNLRQRTLITFSLTGILPMILIGTLCYYQVKSTQGYPPEQMLQNMFYLVCFISGVGLLAIVTLSHLFAISIIDPIQTIEAGMSRVEAGDLDVSVPVYSCDEFGAMMENFNKMVEVLKERYRMKQALNMAMDVQQNLLPRRLPVLDGIDMAAICTACDEIGGDYYDVIMPEASGSENTVFALGDVSDHGIASALLMASARAFIRMRVTMLGSLSEIISDVNVALCRDVDNSGRFMTLFCCRMNRSRNRLTWVNAGHDPAFLYDSATDTIQELRSENLALGIFEESTYLEIGTDIHSGQMLVMGTDGIWEAENPAGERFGKDRFKCLIQRHGKKSAQALVDATVTALHEFCQPSAPEDDMTLLVIRRPAEMTI